VTAVQSTKAEEQAQETQDDSFRVASFQGPIEERNPEASLNRTGEALRWADERDAHVLCMPETYLQGYFDTREEAWAHSIDLESSEFADICAMVAEYRATLLLGLNERRGDDLFNTQVVIERGQLVGRYSKNYLVHKYFRRGLDFPVFERDGVRYGIIICKDSSYVEPTRILAMRGAQVIFSPHFNRMVPENVDSHVRRVRNHHVARAVENGCWVVRSNIIWHHDGVKVGVGDSFILNEFGETVCSAGILAEKILFHAIPRDALEPNTRSWEERDPEIVDELHSEYATLPKPTH
jgi:predicted amidohydrolase